MKRNYKTILKSLLFLLCLSSALPTWALIENSATGLPVTEEAIKTGEALFKKKCAACHSLDRDMTGPKLSGITESRETEWLIKWIRNNVELRNSGDADAIAIYNKYNKSPMLIFNDLDDKQIKELLMYTENGPIKAANADVASETKVAPIDESIFNKTNWMFVILFILGFAVLVYLFKTIDLINKLTKKQIIPWNKVNAMLMLSFLILGMFGAFYELSIHGKYVLLGNSSAEHGIEIDRMMNITNIITGIVFILTHVVLFIFVFKYQAKKGRKATYYPHNNKLELIWTGIPTVVLVILVFGGLSAWKKINSKPDESNLQIEVFAYQFAWQARYPGNDGVLGKANYNLISETNGNNMGVAVRYKAEEILLEINKDIENFEKQIKELPIELGKLKGSVGGLRGAEMKQKRKAIAEIESGSSEAHLKRMIRRRNTQFRRVQAALKDSSFFTGEGLDDIITDEIHLIKNTPVTFKFRGRDVIHSALMKEFRAQMNVVPGVPTQFTFTPILSTQERRDMLDNQEFDYHILCNKICGSSHYNMKIKIVVHEDMEEFGKWYEMQDVAFDAKKAIRSTANVDLNHKSLN